MMCKKDIMLIADDLDINRDVLKEMFQSDFEVIEAENGKECIELVKKYSLQIRIILLDIMMPVMSGLEVLKYRNTDSIFSSIPVIIITINDEIKKQMLAFELGATDYITKPFIREIVIYRINNILSSKKRVEEIMREKENFQIKSELDLMTGLYNKATVEGLISEKLFKNKTKNAILVIDIDNFKQVNDLEGHLVGDHTIRIIADLISGHFRKTDIIGRIGGDEFIIFMEDLPSGEAARKKADELAKLLRYKPNITIPANVSVSIGMALTECRPYTYQELFEKADIALYYVKENGKGQYAEYGTIKKKTVLQQNKKTALLFSRNRNICGIIRMVCGDIQLIEILSPQDGIYFGEKYKNDICILYIDISEEQDNGEFLLGQVKAIDCLREMPYVIICQEGNMKQYAAALKADARDIIPAPIDITFAKRRSSVLLDAKKRK